MLCCVLRVTPWHARVCVPGVQQRDASPARARVRVPSLMSVFRLFVRNEDEMRAPIVELGVGLSVLCGGAWTDNQRIAVELMDGEERTDDAMLSKAQVVRYLSAILLVLCEVCGRLMVVMDSGDDGVPAAMKGIASSPASPA